MARRRWPRTTRPSVLCHSPEESGPRWAIASHICSTRARSLVSGAAPKLYCPAIPHMSAQPLCVPEVEHHRRPEPVAEITLAPAVTVEQIGESVAIEDPELGEAGLE